MERGLFYAFASITLWGLVDASGRVAMSYFHFNPFIFACTSFTYAGVSLLLIAGLGKNGLSTLTHPHTWLWGILRVINLVCLSYAYISVTATEVAFINRISVVIAVLLSFLVLRRKPHPLLLPGFLFISGCVLWLSLRQEGGFTNPAVWSVYLAAVLNAAMALLIETHPDSKKTVGIRARCRYTGVVLLVASLLFITTAFTVNTLEAYLPNAFHQPFAAPSYTDLTKTSFQLFALFMGSLLIAPAMYVTFYAIRLLNTDNMMMVGTILHFATIAFELVLSIFNILDIRAFDGIDLLLGMGVTIGALYCLTINIINRKPHPNA